MKTLIFVILLSIFPILGFSQPSNVDRGIYLVGKNGYAKYPSTTKDIVSENGFMVGSIKCAPALYTYLINKSKYIGGNLIDLDENKTTEIKDIKLEADSSGRCVSFIVEGVDFSKTLILKTDYILKEEDSYSIFESEDVGIWRIEKEE